MQQPGAAKRQSTWRRRALTAVVPRSKAVRLLLVGAACIVAGVIVGLRLLAPVESITYAFTQEAKPAKLSSLNDTPAAVKAAASGLKATLADQTEVTYISGSAATANDPFMEVVFNGRRIKLGVVDAAKPTVTRDAHVVTLRSIRPGVDLVYSNHQDFVKEDIIAKTRQAASGLTFFVPKERGVHIERDAVGGLIGTVNENPLFYFHPPSVNDATGKKIEYEYILNERDNRYLLSLVPTHGNELARAILPLTIDPTISWAFENDAPYYLSDPQKIEVAAGVLQLVNNGGSYAHINLANLYFYTLNKKVWP